MRAKVVDRADVLAIVDLLRRDYEVIAPFYGRGRDTYFDVVTDENRPDVQIHLPNPYYPPKRYVFPQIQRLLLTRRAADGEMRVGEVLDEPKRAIFGIRSCDLAGIGHLDRFYLGRNFRDVYYEKLRRQLFLVNVVCTDTEVDIDDDCFCVCADTGPAAREHFDLQLMDLGDVFLAVAGTPAGETLLAHPIFKPASQAHVTRRRAMLTEVRKRFKDTTSWYAMTARLISRGDVADKVWEQIGRRCMECGGCSYVCPTCTCFTVADRSLDGDMTERVRLWDACALSGFTRMAGGHNPRKAVHDRRNRRFFRKLSHYFIQRELSVACVGCGRCVAVCHGDIGMPSVVEIIRRALADAPAPARVETP
ncbi:MAG: 4Fe-4S dicluster domain-containing protein [Armatimonadota bacterium]|nr:4Fe-4S dicluster domain-containing protein [Armatimonadota bacterium]